MTSISKGKQKWQAYSKACQKKPKDKALRKHLRSYIKGEHSAGKEFWEKTVDFLTTSKKGDRKIMQHTRVTNK